MPIRMMGLRVCYVPSRSKNTNCLSSQISTCLMKGKSYFKTPRLSFSNIGKDNVEKLNSSRIYTIPNIITMSRIAASPIISIMIVCDMKEEAFYLCILAAFSDWLDGYIAKNFDQSTTLGAFLDPLADKIMIGSLTLGLTAKGLLPMPLACIILGRDIFLLAASFYIRMIERPPNTPFFDTTYSATFEITPSLISKVNTVLQFGLIVSTLGNFSWGFPLLEHLEPLWWLTGSATIASGLGYLSGSGLKRLSKPGIGRGGRESK